MIEFSTWDIVRGLVLAARWTVILSLVAFVCGGITGLVGANGAGQCQTAAAVGNEPRKRQGPSLAANIRLRQLGNASVQLCNDVCGGKVKGTVAGLTDVEETALRRKSFEFRSVEVRQRTVDCGIADFPGNAVHCSHRQRFGGCKVDAHHAPPQRQRSL